MQTGDDLKVHLPGESPWAIVLAQLPDGRILARMNNDLVMTSKHGYRFGDVATFEIEETPEYKIWTLSENQLKVGPTALSSVAAGN